MHWSDHMPAPVARPGTAPLTAAAARPPPPHPRQRARASLQPLVAASATSDMTTLISFGKCQSAGRRRVFPLERCLPPAAATCRSCRLLVQSCCLPRLCLLWLSVPADVDGTLCHSVGQRSNVSRRGAGQAGMGDGGSACCVPAELRFATSNKGRDFSIKMRCPHVLLRF